MARDWLWSREMRIIPISIIALFCTLLVWALVVVFTGGPVTQREAPGSQIYMRGREIVKVRINNGPEAQAISICHDGTAARSLIPPDPHMWTYYQLTASELEALARVRTTWCAQPPTFSAAVHTAHDYDVGIRCTDSYAIMQFSVPETQLPEVLVQLERVLPAFPRSP